MKWELAKCVQQAGSKLVVGLEVKEEEETHQSGMELWGISYIVDSDNLGSSLSPLGISITHYRQDI
jgi:hypothetical protein